MRLGALSNQVKARFLPYGFLFLTALLLLAPAIVKPGLTLSPAEILFRSPFYAEYPPSEKIVNPIFFDVVYGCIPNSYFAWECLRRKQAPFWNPHSLCGSPLLGTTILVSLFFPINVITALFPFRLSLVIRALLRFGVAGIFTYELALSYSLRRAGALLAAVCYMLSGFMIVWQGFPHANVACVIPAVIWATDRIVRVGDLKRRLTATAWSALANAVMFLGGQFQISLLVCLVQLAYVLLATILNSGGEIREAMRSACVSLCMVGIALVTAVAMAAPQIFPFVEWWRLSQEVHLRASLPAELWRSDFWKDLFALPLLVFPNLYGNPAWDMPYRPFLLWANNYLEWTAYTGVVALGGAVVTLFHWRRCSASAKVWLILVFLCLFTIARIPPFDWLFQLPGLRLITKGRERVLLCLGLSLLAGFGLELLYGTDRWSQQTSRRAWSATMICIFAAGLTMALVLGTTLPLFRQQIVALGERLAEREYHGLNMEYHRAQVQKIANGIINAFAITNVRMYSPSWFALIGWLLARARRESAVSPFGSRKRALVLLATVDLLVWGSELVWFTPGHRFYPPTQITRFLEQDKDLFRVVARDRDFVPDAHIMYGLSDVRGIDHQTTWYAQYVSLIPERDTRSRYGLYFTDVRSPLLRVLNVKYYITADTNTVKDATLVLRPARTGGVALWQLDHAQPRSFMVFEAVVAHTDAEAAALLSAEPARVFERVVLSNSGGDARIRSLKPSGQGHHASVEVVQYEPGRSLWRVNSPDDGYLVTTDAYYPGWEVYVDGHRATLYRANLAFRAVFVPKGIHMVEYRYRPKSLRIGGLACIVGVTAFLAFLGLGNAARCA